VSCYPSMSFHVAESKQRRTKMLGLRVLAGGAAVRGCLALVALVKAAHEFDRDTDWAQRTVAFVGGACEGEAFLSGVLTAVAHQQARR
jgi:hypothetical protein